MHKPCQIHSMQPLVPPKGWRKRYGYYGIDWESDTIFLPGELFGNPTALFLCASFDGEPLLSHGNMPLFRSVWLKRQCPKSIDDIEFIEAKIRQNLSPMGEGVQGGNN